MAQPTTRVEFTEYCLRKLGAPVLEINVDDDQVDDLIDDAIQLYQEYHFDGVEKMFLKHLVTADDVERFNRAEFINTKDGNDGGVTYTVTSTGFGYLDGEQTNVATDYPAGVTGTGSGLTVDIKVTGGVVTEVLINEPGQGYVVGDELTIGTNTSARIRIDSIQSDSRWQNRGNFFPIPDHVIGVSKVYGISSGLSDNEMWGFANQYFLMDVFSVNSGYTFSNFDMSYYYMIKQWFETLDMVINTGNLVNYRFNKKQDRLYLDISVNRIKEGQYILIDCHRALDPSDWSQVWNDSWLKRYAPALIKRQWGQNMIKFNNVQLPGGITMNGRQLYEDAEKEILMLESKLRDEYQLPPMDMIG